MSERVGKRPDLPYGFGQNGKVHPTPESRKRLASKPCALCDSMGPPTLVNHASELYWQHRWEKGGARETCRRFSMSDWRGTNLDLSGTLPPVPE